MTPRPITLDGRSLAIGDVVRIAREPGATPRIDSTARDALVASRRLVEQAIASGQTIYGINTGFGKLANVRIAPDRLDALQVNLIRSHAAGVGAPLVPGVVRAVMLLRAKPHSCDSSLIVHLPLRPRILHVKMALSLSSTASLPTEGRR